MSSARPRRLQTRFVVAGCLVAAATVASGIWSAYTFIQLSRVIGETLRASQQQIDLIAKLTAALAREDDALLLVNGNREQAAREVASQRALFDQAFDTLWTILPDPDSREIGASLRRHANAYRVAGDKLLAGGRPTHAAGLDHGMANPILRGAVMDSANLRELTFSAMQRASMQARDQATRAIGVVAAVSLVAVLVSTLAAVHLARAVGRPIGELTVSVEAVRLGQFDRRVSVESTDELGRLARGFNRMAEALGEFRRSNLGEVVRAKETLESTLAVLPDAVIVIDSEGRITSLNPLAHAVLDAAGAGSASRVEDLPLSGDCVKAIAEALHGMRSSGAPLEASRTVSVVLDGRPRRFSPAVVPVQASSAEQYGAVVVLTDVTEFVRLDELRAELIALVSHELKTPLTTLRMNLLMLSERPADLTSRQGEVLTAAIAGCEDLAGTIDELLDLSRIEAGQLRLACTPIDLYPLIEQAVERFRPRYREAGVRLVVSREAPRATVLGDATRLGLVVSNLLSNALNYTPERGAVTVAVSSMQNARSGRAEYVQLAVTDTGPGIAEEFRERVFEKFFRIESRRDPGRIAPQGVGFGLYLCRQIVEAHGGTIRCEVGEGDRGTRIALCLPAGVATS